MNVGMQQSDECRSTSTRSAWGGDAQASKKTDAQRNMPPQRAQTAQSQAEASLTEIPSIQKDELESPLNRSLKRGSGLSLPLPPFKTMQTKLSVQVL